MKATIILCLLLGASVYATAQQARNLRSEAARLRNALTSKHVSPRPFDDGLSSDMLDQVLDRLDPDKLLFTVQDIQWMESYRTLIDDEINGENWTFLSRLKARFQSSVERAQRNYASVLDQRIDFIAREVFDDDAEAWSANEDALHLRQKQWLKYQVLEKILTLNGQDSASTCAVNLNRYLPEAVSRVKKSALRELEQMLDPAQLDDLIGATFFDAMTTVFDPHTKYFSPYELKDFIGNLNTENYYFGFAIDADDAGEIVITSLSPGSPAWKSGELHVADKLVAVKPEGGTSVDLTEMTIHEANETLDRMSSDVIDFTVKKPDGVEKTVRLKKEKMESEENFVRSFVLDGSQKVGYIHLPDFYTRWGNASEGSRCANDVAREIIKLKKDQIQGLILDLRFNGGGSLYEALAMAGIFIEEGPLAILKDNTQKASTLKDMNRGTVYDGPLIIMVNGYSASASELLAAAIQDYNRGLIVGSPTYGKATGQNILPLGEGTVALTADQLQGKDGYIKVTTERLYRVTGKSLQGRGVIPDVVLPDIFSALKLNESSLAFSLPADSINKNTYYKPLPSLNRKDLAEKSLLRLGKSQSFAGISKSLLWLSKNIAQDRYVPLDWEAYCSREKESEAQQFSYVLASLLVNPAFDVKNNSSEQQRLAMDEFAERFNLQWSKKLRNDLYLSETYQIMIDYIAQQNKP